MEILQKQVVVLGGGFAGLRVVSMLLKKVPPECKVILVDKNKGHLYTPDLYEIASSPHDKISEECLTELRDTVVTPIESIFCSKNFEFLNDEVLKINPEDNSVDLKRSGKLCYDYLAVCLGSSSNTFNILGLEQFSYPVKNIADAIAINCHLDSFFKELWKAGKKGEISINVGGGGATGVEFSAELSSYINFLCVKYKYPRESVKIQIIQGGEELIGLGKEVSDIALRRLNSHGVNVLFGSYINKVEADKIELKNKVGELSTIKSDLLLWTGGVKANPVVSEAFAVEKSCGAIPVNAFLQSEKFKNVFACGDSAFVLNAKNQRVLMMAQFAFQEASVVGKNISSLINCDLLKSGEEKSVVLLKYVPSEALFIIPIAGKFGIIKYGNLVFSGFLCWIVRRLTDLYYCLRILPILPALRKWMKGNKVFVGND